MRVKGDENLQIAVVCSTHILYSILYVSIYVYVSIYIYIYIYQNMFTNMYLHTLLPLFSRFGQSMEDTLCLHNDAGHQCVSACES